MSYTILKLSVQVMSEALTKAEILSPKSKDSAGKAQF